jgi:dihydrofolate reductase
MRRQIMAKLRVHNLATSLDGFAAGPDQSLENPLGVGGEALHTWYWKTAFGKDMQGEGEPGETGVDNDYLLRGVEGIGATIMGRNMFGPVRGPWPDESWTGWWGPNPPYHHPVFVRTHYPRPSVEMEGGTTFHFVDDDDETVLAKAVEAAGGLDVRLAGGAATVRAYLAKGLVDELHLPISPILLGGGERPLDGIRGYVVSKVEQGEGTVHYTLVRG